MAYNAEKAIARGNPRAIAKASGEIMYLPDKACPKGHQTARYTKYGQCLDCLKLSKAAYRAGDKSKVTEQTYSVKYQSKNKLLIRAKQYNLTVEELKSIFEAQKGNCKICPTMLSLEGRGTHIDHCHDTNIVRGLLCRNCNVGLGLFKHD